MNLEESLLVKIWKEAAKELNGNFSMPLQIYNGGNMAGGMFLFCIDINYRELEIKIEAGILELPLRKNEYNDCIITITASKKTTEIIELSIWRKDFLDKIFDFGNTKTGYKDFDTIIGLDASRNIRRYLPKVFENKRLREEIQEDRLRTYNVSTNQDVVSIRRKSGLLMRNPEMIKVEYDKFCLFLDCLLDSNLV
ncbi:MAG: hypothetical protein RBS81_11720 [Tenuifilaceae bacterium]|jgi:hypothetical protein|nr:hypothetical protein [Tenuifilaceae bacterium]